jgi:hypothetical protein
MSWLLGKKEVPKETNQQKQARGLVKITKYYPKSDPMGRVYYAPINVWGTPEEADQEHELQASREKAEVQASIKSLLVQYEYSMRMLIREKEELEAKISDAGIEELKSITLSHIEKITSRINQLENEIFSKKRELNQTAGRRKKTRKNRSRRS